MKCWTWAKCRQRHCAPKPGGYTPYQHLLRDPRLLLLMVFTCEIFKLQPTRNRQAKRAGQPCGASLVAATVQRLGIDVSESRLTNLWGKNGGQRGAAAVRQFRSHVQKKLGLPAI
jgi:hypothetical protein